MTFARNDALDHRLNVTPPAFTPWPVYPAETQCQVARGAGACAHRPCEVLAERLGHAVNAARIERRRVLRSRRTGSDRGVRTRIDNALDACTLGSNKNGTRTKRIDAHRIERILVGGGGEARRQVHDGARCRCGYRGTDGSRVADVADDVRAIAGVERERLMSGRTRLAHKPRTQEAHPARHDERSRQVQYLITPSRLNASWIRSAYVLNVGYSPR